MPWNKASERLNDHGANAYHWCPPDMPPDGWQFRYAMDCSCGGRFTASGYHAHLMSVIKGEWKTIDDNKNNWYTRLPKQQEAG